MSFADIVKDIVEGFKEQGWTEEEVRNVIDKASDKETVKIKITKVKEVVEPMRMEEQNEKE